MTEEDRGMVIYFIQEKGDVERWVSWEDKKDEIFREHPDLKDALDRVESAERFLQAVLDDL